MIKLIIMFRKPADAAAFEGSYATQYVPAANLMPFIKKTAVARVMGAPKGEAPYYLMHEMYFEDMAEVNQALNSPEGRSAGTVLMSFAREIVSIMFAEVWE